jgi:hypothetical protein
MAGDEARGMLRGHLDIATSSGYIEGWAFDSDNVLRAVPVTARVGGEEIASGLANRYRWDLIDANCGTGWSAFRLKLSRCPANLAEQTVDLIETVSGCKLCSVTDLAIVVDQESPPTLLRDVIGSDPTMVYSIEALRGCVSVLESFLGIAGPEGFVRAAYIYILGRFADAAATAAYGTQLCDGTLAPYDLLKILYESAEFQSDPRLLAAPPDPGFAFHLQ